MEIGRPEVLMTRAGSVAGKLEKMLAEARRSIDVAVYRFNHPRLQAALTAAANRDVSVRLVLDGNKFQESRSTRELFSNGPFPYRLSGGRPRVVGKMHHKFAILDGQTLFAGSYNWTLESEDQNFENLLVLREPELVDRYGREFESLWAEATPPGPE